VEKYGRAFQGSVDSMKRRRHDGWPRQG